MTFSLVDRGDLPQTLHVVDCNYYMRRGAAVMTPLSFKNQTTTAIKAIVDHVLRLQRIIGDARLALVFDPGGATEKRKLWSGYKASRGDGVDEQVKIEFASQVKIAVRLLKAMGFEVYQVPEVEADDVIATLVAQHKGPVVIHSNDKDLLQLVTPQVKMQTNNHGLMGPADVKTRIGVEPSQIVHYLALVGDKDEVPGIQGVGPVKAIEWLTQYRDMKTIYANRSKLGKLGLRLKKRTLQLNCKLARARTNVVLPDSPVRENPKLAYRIKQEIGFK